jgi:phospholipid/cholesterol/gamma-HCH transport system ATP-binding protein
MESLRLNNVYFSHKTMSHVSPDFKAHSLRKRIWTWLEDAGVTRAVMAPVERPILKGASLSVDQGEVLCIAGASGQGKSSLLRVIAGLEKPSAGEISYFGERIELDALNALNVAQRGVGYVFQNCALISNLRVSDNIALPLRYHQRGSEAEIQEKVSRALQLMLVEETRDHFPYSLSLGMKKRVAVARAWAMDPRILLMDEPTSGLDNSNRRNLLPLIENLRELYKTTILIVTHDLLIPKELRCKICFLDNGMLTDPMRFDDMKHSDHPLVRDLTQDITFD